MHIRTLGKKLLSNIPLLDGLFRRFIWSRIHFHEAEMRFLNGIESGSIDVALDVGAALGCYSWILGRVSRRVYAFEPGHLHNQYLNRAAFWSNISVIHMAAGSVCNRVAFYTPGSDSDALHSATLSQGNPVVRMAGTHVDQVDQITLDSFLAQKLEPGRSVDVLKVDVEGYELEVFKGAGTLLSLHQPLIICEIEVRHNANYAEVFDLLRGQGYDCFIFREGAFRPFADNSIEGIQLEKDLKIRIGSNFDPDRNEYINNFVFQHPNSRIKVTGLQQDSSRG